ncbi:MAG: hypothetical protein ACFFC6_12595 [Promethearchaeota archaeon]
MLKAKATLKISENKLFKSISNFMVIWFSLLLCFYVLSSFSTLTFIFMMEPFFGFTLPLIFDYFLEGILIVFISLYPKHLLENYQYFRQLNRPRLQLFLAVLILIFAILLAIFLLIAFIFGTIIGNLSTYQSFPARDVANQGVADVMGGGFMLESALLLVLLGIIILIKNSVSKTTRLFFLSFLVIGTACFMYVLYALSYPAPIPSETDPNTVIWLENPQTTTTFFLFFLLIQIGFFILIHAIRSITSAEKIWLPKSLYLVFFIILSISTILLSSGEIKHVFLFSHEILGASLRVREFSIGFALIYLVIQIVPIVISLYYLRQLPPWITLERRAWLKRIKLAIIIYSFFPICETIAGLRIPLTTGFISPYNPVEQYKLLLAVAFLLLFLSALVLYSGVPELNKWFFDEIKFRASPELRRLNPQVNLASIWEQVDEWQKESELTPKEMTIQKLEEYVQAAKQLMLKEEEKTIGL